MRFSKSLSVLGEQAKETVERVEDWATRPYPPVWQVVVGAIVVLLLMRALVVMF